MACCTNQGNSTTSSSIVYSFAFVMQEFARLFNFSYTFTYDVMQTEQQPHLSAARRNSSVGSDVSIGNQEVPQSSLVSGTFFGRCGGLVVNA